MIYFVLLHIQAIFQAERNLELIIRVFSKRRDDAQFNQNLKELFKDRLGDDELVVQKTKITYLKQSFSNYFTRIV